MRPAPPRHACVCECVPCVKLLHRSCQWSWPALTLTLQGNTKRHFAFQESHLKLHTSHFTLQPSSHFISLSSAILHTLGVFRKACAVAHSKRNNKQLWKSTMFFWNKKELFVTCLKIHRKKFRTYFFQTTIFNNLEKVSENNFLAE